MRYIWGTVVSCYLRTGGEPVADQFGKLGKIPHERDWISETRAITQCRLCCREGNVVAVFGVGVPKLRSDSGEWRKVKRF